MTDPATPRITVITPVWNCADTVGHCLRSIAGQTESCEHIVVDGGSSDGTLDVIETHRSPATRVISGPDQGMYDAINKGLALARGDIVGILNADDFFESDTVLEKVTRAFESPEVSACYGDLLYVERNDTARVVRKWKSGTYRRQRFFNGWMPPHPTFYLRKQFYDDYGGYRLDMGSAADYELMLRMLMKHSLSATYIPEVLVRMRNEGMSNASLGNRIRANRKDRQAWRVNQLSPRPWTLLAKPLSKLGQWW